MESPHPKPQLIETMCLNQGQIALWPGHRARLLASAQVLGYPLSPSQLDQQMATFLQNLSTQPATAHPPGPWRIRLLLAADGCLTIEPTRLPPTPTPVRIALASKALSPDLFWLKHKTTYRPWYSAAQLWLQKHPDYFDLIFGNTHDELCEGSRCNIYVQDTQGQWLTPPLACGLLPGVQRQALLAQGLAHEARLSPNDLHQARAIRVSNALRGWLDACLDSNPARSGPDSPEAIVSD